MCVCLVWFGLLDIAPMLSAAEAKSSYRFSPNTHARTKSELRKSTWILLTSNIIPYRSKVFFLFEDSCCLANKLLSREWRPMHANISIAR